MFPGMMSLGNFGAPPPLDPLMAADALSDPGALGGALSPADIITNGGFNDDNTYDALAGGFDGLPLGGDPLAALSGDLGGIGSLSQGDGVSDLATLAQLAGGNNGLNGLNGEGMDPTSLLVAAMLAKSGNGDSHHHNHNDSNWGGSNNDNWGDGSAHNHNGNDSWNGNCNNDNEGWGSSCSGNGSWSGVVDGSFSGNSIYTSAPGARGGSKVNLSNYTDASGSVNLLTDKNSRDFNNLGGLNVTNYKDGNNTDTVVKWGAGDQYQFVEKGGEDGRLDFSSNDGKSWHVWNGGSGNFGGMTISGNKGGGYTFSTAGSGSGSGAFMAELQKDGNNIDVTNMSLSGPGLSHATGAFVNQRQPGSNHGYSSWGGNGNNGYNGY